MKIEYCIVSQNEFHDTIPRYTPLAPLAQNCVILVRCTDDALAVLSLPGLTAGSSAVRGNQSSLQSLCQCSAFRHESLYGSISSYSIDLSYRKHNMVPKQHSRRFTKFPIFAQSDASRPKLHRAAHSYILYRPLYSYETISELARKQLSEKTGMRVPTVLTIYFHIDSRTHACIHMSVQSLSVRQNRESDTKTHNVVTSNFQFYHRSTTGTSSPPFF
jgi:hypothetical protein